jgi:predicted O-methyltransferase YrrM
MALEAAQVDVLSIFRNNMRLLGLNNVRSLVMTSREAMDILPKATFDFIYIDADHSYSQVLVDLEWYDWLRSGGILAGHDFDEGHPGVKRAVEDKFSGRIQVGIHSTIWSVRKE